jgi:ribonuclease J
MVGGGAGGRLRVMMLEDGDILHFDEDGARVEGRAPAGRVLIDGTRVGEVGDEVLRDRRHLSTDGVVVPIIAINRQTGQVEGLPNVIARGFVDHRRTGRRPG